MTRYVALADAPPPRAWVSHSEHGWQDRPSAVVWEAEAAPQRTGLLDAHGVPLYRIRETVPLGFDLRLDGSEASAR